MKILKKVGRDIILEEIFKIMLQVKAEGLPRPMKTISQSMIWMMGAFKLLVLFSMVESEVYSLLKKCLLNEFPLL